MSIPVLGLHEASPGKDLRPGASGFVEAEQRSCSPLESDLESGSTCRAGWLREPGVGFSFFGPGEAG